MACVIHCGALNKHSYTQASLLSPSGEHSFTIIYNDPKKRQQGLAFNSNEDELATMDEQREALEILSSAAQLSHDQDMRTGEVFEALDYLKQCLTRSGAINDFKKALAIQHPDDRERALRRLFNSIVDLVTG